MASFLSLYCNLSTYLTPCSTVSFVNFEHVIAGYDKKPSKSIIRIYYKEIIWITSSLWDHFVLGKITDHKIYKFYYYTDAYVKPCQTSKLEFFEGK